MGQHFRALWNTKLKLMTGGVLAICLVAMFAVRGWGVLVILAIVLVALAFSVRGYSIAGGQLLILRLGWATRFELSQLASAEISPGATLGSLRTMGIGGLFGYVGRYHNAILGPYKAYATNDIDTVVLVFGEETIVVTPEDPHAFVEALEGESHAT